MPLFDDRKLSTEERDALHKKIAIEQGKPFHITKSAVKAMDEWKTKDNYITSFCESGDLLSQWRGYADRGGGYAIGLSVDQNYSVYGKNKYKLIKMIYEADQQESQIENIVDRILAIVPQVKYPESFNAEFSEVTKQLGYFVASTVISSGLHFKHEAFSEEKEWRFLAQKEPGETEGVAFRESDGLLVPYLELPIKAEGIELKEIICGPTLHPQLSNRSVQMLARKRGFPNVNVVNSAIPLVSH